MLKKFSALALAGLLALPAAASAGSSDVAAQIDRLTKELETLKAQMAIMKEDKSRPVDNSDLRALKADVADMKEAQEEAFDDLDERSEAWDLASRFKFYGDFRARADIYDGDLVSTPLDINYYQDWAQQQTVMNPNNVMNISHPLMGANVANPFGVTWGDMMSPDAVTKRAAQMRNLGYYYFGMLHPSDQSAIPMTPAFQDDDEMASDSLFTNRFRLNMRVKATENVEFKARLAMYKVWGTNTTAPGLSTFNYPSFDGTSTREASDSTLRVDRAFVNWNSIGGQPIWFSIGRRPTTDGPAAHVRMGNDQRMATPTAYMDWPFDGLSIGYAYANLFGINDAPGRVRFCYGRGFENGLEYDNVKSDLNDTDFAGVSWDVYKKGDRFAYIQSFMIFNAFNFPEFNDDDTNDFFEFFLGERNDIGDVLHTSAVYQDKWENLTYFVSGGWSHTMPDDDTGMFNDFLADFTSFMNTGSDLGTVRNDDNENGYNIWLGARYDLDDLGLKFGLEYNYGSRYWIGMTPGHDDMYSAKLATRGDVYEAYMIWDLPTGEKVSKYAKTFVRLGYQYYDYDYTGGSDWNIKPYEIGDNEADMMGNLMPSLDDAHQVYLTFEAYF